ncbi:unnamed protein product, partial [Symbiodinium sp. KB8]
DHAHTVYPVLLASADFQDWWVVGDKRFAHPTPFWSKHTERRGVTYVRATSACTSPPPAGVMPKGLSGAYVMACITWRSANLDELSAATTVTDAQVAQLCQAVGGVCGWSCGSKHSPLNLRGCDDNGKIEVTKTSFAGKNYHDANFQGKVVIRQCPEVDEDGNCVTSEAVFSHWRCHNCKYNPNEITEDSWRRLQIIPGLPDFPGGGLPGIPGIGGIGGGGIPVDGDVPAGLPGGSGFPSDGEDAKSSYIYTSLPKLEVSVTGLGAPDDDNILSQPGVVILESSETTPNSWQPLYREAYIKTKPPIAVDPSGQPLTGPVDEDAEEDYEEQGPKQGAFSRHRMHLSQGNRLTMEPKWCFGKQGPLYLVACAVNGSIYGKQVLALCPGIFWPYRHYRRYDPELTEYLRFINVCVPSEGENKAVTLRSLIGAIGCMPKECSCRFHITLVDDEHRLEMMQMFLLLTKVVEAIPGYDSVVMNENVREFFLVWVESTKKVDITQLRENALTGLEKETAEWLSGLSTYQTLRENSWAALDARTVAPLEAAVTALYEALLSADSEVFSMQRDTVVDWEPKQRNSLPLRLHYLARAKPSEDERTVKTQHVAPGIYYYKVPINAEDSEWLSLRGGLKEMVYGLEEQDHSVNLVPIHTSRGVPGALNFAANFLFMSANRPENAYGDSRDYSPCLFSICDPYHQFQPDYFHTIIPHFFDRNGELDSEADEALWVTEQSRVRLGNKKRTRQMIERKYFPETCKVENIASSMNDVLSGRRSSFINRRLSYGISRSGTEALGSLQQWKEGQVVFWLQSFFGRQGFTLWLTLGFFIYFLVRLCVLVTNTTSRPLVFRLGLLDERLGTYFQNKPTLINIYVVMLVEFAFWLGGLVGILLLVFLVTECLKACTAFGCFSCDWVPNEMRHWARLLIRMGQTSGWVWWWLPFFWIGFNYWNVFAGQSYHFNCIGMFIFIVTLQILNWGMVVWASLRSSLQASMETNEVIFLSMDSVWRSTQSFYVAAPVQVYSIIKAVEDYVRYHFYGEDITFQRASETRHLRAEMSITLIKFWTLLLLLGAVGAWVHYAMAVRVGNGALASCIVVTLIALDCLHPCAYLWVGQAKQMTDQQAGV